MKTVYKFKLDNKVPMPRGAVPLHATDVGGQPYVWAEVDMDVVMDGEANYVFHYFDIIGTGHTFPPVEGSKFLNTIVVQDGMFVFHIYDLGEF